MQTLIILDAHVTADEDLTRFSRCGKMIVERQPEEIIILGDFVSLDSLSDFDMNKRLLMEQRRYKADIRGANMALDLLLSPLQNYNVIQRANKQKQYKPKLVYLEGNHEFRAERYVQTHAELKGFMDVPRDLRVDARGFLYIPYRSFYRVANTTYVHCPMNKANQPIS